VIDLELHDETGPGIFGLLNTPGCRKASRIIAKTSRQNESLLGQVYWLGIDAILLKPTSAEELVGTVQAVLSGRPKWFC
jgi:DNA-binding NarL/FixJ family response regulator